MKKKTAAGYVAVIAALAGLSIVTPLVIRSVSDYVVERVNGRTMEEETQAGTEDGLATIEAAEGESEDTAAGGTGSKNAADTGEKANVAGGKANSVGEKANASGMSASSSVIVDDTGIYTAPVYATDEEEAAANQETYDDMVETLGSQEEAVAEYREAFNPVYDELTDGLMSDFILGREQDFYEAIANYCFGHYNTTNRIGLVRFDAMLEDTDAKATVILEFFTNEDLTDEAHTPDLAVCTYNKKTKAYVFVQSTSR